MSRKRTLSLLLGSVLALLACTLIGRVIAPSANAQFATAAAALAFITAAAVGIERVIEAFWTVIGGLKGSYWPLRVVAEQVDALTDDLDAALAPVHAAVGAELTRLAKVNGWSAQQLAAAQQELATWRTNFDKLKTLPVDNQRIQLLGASASQQLQMIAAKYGAGLGHAQGATEVAKAAIDGMQNFLASFKDNPGRRLISLFLGACMGVLLASGSGLDLFKASMEAPDWRPGVQADAAQPVQAPGAEDEPPPIRGYLAIWLTGIIIGLGSSPTHEIIRAVQEYKKNRKGENASMPDQP